MQNSAGRKPKYQLGDRKWAVCILDKEAYYKVYTIRQVTIERYKVYPDKSFNAFTDYHTNGCSEDKLYDNLESCYEANASLFKEEHGINTLAEYKNFESLVTIREISRAKASESVKNYAEHKRRKFFPYINMSYISGVECLYKEATNYSGGINVETDNPILAMAFLTFVLTWEYKLIYAESYAPYIRGTSDATALDGFINYAIHEMPPCDNDGKFLLEYDLFKRIKQDTIIAYYDSIKITDMLIENKYSDVIEQLKSRVCLEVLSDDRLRITDMLNEKDSRNFEKRSVYELENQKDAKMNTLIDLLLRAFGRRLSESTNAEFTYETTFTIQADEEKSPDYFKREAKKFCEDLKLKINSSYPELVITKTKLLALFPGSTAKNYTFGMQLKVEKGD